MYSKTQIFFCLIFLLGSLTVSGQKLLKKAELQSENGDFQLAIDSYKDYLKDNPNDYYSISKLADCYAANGQFAEALRFYESIADINDINPQVYKSYGDALKRIGKHKDAKAKYELYKKSNPLEAEHLIKSCDFAINALKSKPEFETFVMPSNSSMSDFGLTFYLDMPVFSSFRNDILLSETEKEINIQNGAHRSFLYNPNKNKLGFIKSIGGSINHIGPISFSSNGKKCAIIESKIQDSYSFVTNTRVSSLHIANVNPKGEIVSSKPFAYNEVGSSINSAHMAFDGTAMYFSSDRKGGYGGFDVYVSYFQNGEWSLPKNLGNAINSIGNEITPFLKGNDLYFASNYHYNMGGYDVFKSSVVNGVWTKPENLGTGVNSISDDYFPAFNNLGELYITSNRLGGRGSNDIYKTLKLNEIPIEKDIVEINDIPKAVSLDDLAVETQKHTVATNNATKVALSEKEEKVEEYRKNTAFELPEFNSEKVGTNAVAQMSSETAQRKGVDEFVPNTQVFFIQLASVSSVKPSFAPFKSLVRFGNIYKMNNNLSIKVRLGYFAERKEAEEVLAKVRASGFKDAFITFEFLNTSQMELVLSSSDQNSFADEGNLNSKKPSDEIRNFKVGSKYKVRLASYEDPIWFDVNKVKDIGRIEQWTKGGWTIFILAGYNDLEEAKQALIQANNRGFKTAEVVIDNGGILERLKQN